MKTIKGLGGYVCVRNGNSLDYCWQEAVSSLLQVCEKVIICDSDSTDGTREEADRWTDIEPRLTVINYPWPDPKGKTSWWVDWLNFARENLDTPMQVYVDADEVLYLNPEAHTILEDAVANKKSLRVDRLNFWKDARHLIPDGFAVGKFVVRVGPSNYESVSDEPRHKGERKIIDEAIDAPEIKIYHMGFLRKKEAFYSKSKVVLHAFFNRWDTRLEVAEQQNKELWESECEFSDKLVSFNGTYPESVIKWLKARKLHA